MDNNNIRNYAKLMQELGLTGLEVSENGIKLRLERNEQTTQTAAPAVPVSASTPAISPDDFTSITSPMVGVFYSAPSEDATPYVKVGDTIHKGDVLCIIEAMKLMNEITSDADGVLAEVCVGNNQIVDYGHILFRLKKE